MSPTVVRIFGDTGVVLGAVWFLGPDGLSVFWLCCRRKANSVGGTKPKLECG